MYLTRTTEEKKPQITVHTTSEKNDPEKSNNEPAIWRCGAGGRGRVMHVSLIGLRAGKGGEVVSVRWGRTVARHNAHRNVQSMFQHERKSMYDVSVTSLP